MMKYSRLTKRYGPRGNAGLVSGIAYPRCFTSCSVMGSFLLREIEHAHAVHHFTRLEALAARPGAAHVGDPGLPELAGGRAREFVVLRIAGGRQALVDEMRDGDRALVLGQWREQLVVRVVAQRRGQLLQQPAEGVAQLLPLLHALGVEAGLARVLHVPGTLLHLAEV